MVATFITTNPPEISPKTQSTNPRKLGREENFESEAKKSKLIENVHENENMEVDEEINRRVKKISITVRMGNIIPFFANSKFFLALRNR